MDDLDRRHDELRERVRDQAQRCLELRRRNKEHLADLSARSDLLWLRRMRGSGLDWAVLPVPTHVPEDLPGASATP